MTDKKPYNSVDDVIALLDENKNQRGIDNWEKLSNKHELTSYGIGLTQLRKLAKKIGRNRSLSALLWQSDVYDAKVIALLIDDPKAITEAQAEQQVDELAAGMLVHVYSSCDATLAKSPLAFDLANRWLETDDEYRRKSAYGLLYELSKNKRNAKLTDEFFFNCLDHLEERLKADNESKSMRLAMGGSLMGIGKRNKALNLRSAQIAKDIGPIDFNEDGAKCDPFDVHKHLVSPSLLEKLNKS
ncbi:hypothetical protein tloyanaT_20920 [Thalassotalea loyana]|uniref:DNA alkylation repair protein n=1 Tax=Thalassotalea loyana TaxID=280483 RepID=A0ABQ6HGG4_9GAMM|nr:DNA alkylation repair protein [Thalassotalea loyana]GLX85840.1 hypothetical protein tloyanaT_20920 [Thalassotalea loyana]